jgi:ankyrin repeat protein
MKKNKDVLNNVSLMNDSIIIKLIKKSQDNDKDVYLNFLKDNMGLINFDKPKFSPPLTLLIYQDKNILSKYFIEHNMGIHSKSNDFQLPISTAVSKNNIEITKLLIKKEVDIIYGGLDNEFLPLNIAINNDFLDLAEILINNINKYDMIDNYKNTALHYLADNLITYYKNNKKDLEKKAIHLIKKLVEHSDIDFPNNDGLTVRKLLESYLKVRKDKKKDKNIDKNEDISKLNKSIKSIEKKDYNFVNSDIDIVKSNKKYNNVRRSFK